ncbi:MAG: TRAP transporter small permease [Synergistetes bacterium]|nr:TRAP transporter small permease [Synergistota bacterium]MDW8191749.1 TRAP transporter small permease [Synergistota bacterium]
MKVRTLSQLLSGVCLWAAGIILIANVGSMAVNIFLRYSFKYSFTWVEEFARFSLIWVVMLAATPALYYGDHMFIDFVVKRLPPSFRLPMLWFKRVVVSFILILMIYYGVKYAIDVKMFITLAMNISKAIPVSAIPIGSALALLEFILLEFERSVGKP